MFAVYTHTTLIQGPVEREAHRDRGRQCVADRISIERNKAKVYGSACFCFSYVCKEQLVFALSSPPFDLLSLICFSKQPQYMGGSLFMLIFRHSHHTSLPHTTTTTTAGAGTDDRVSQGAPRGQPGALRHAGGGEGGPGARDRGRHIQVR